MVVDSCYGDGGGIPLQPAENKCNIERLAEVVDGLNETMDKDRGRHDAHQLCRLPPVHGHRRLGGLHLDRHKLHGGFLGKRNPGIDRVRRLRTLRLDEHGPQNNETLVEQCNHGSWGYCKDYPNHEWCKDPCCNWEMQQTMCCAPKNATVSVFRPKLKTADYVFECLSTAFENSKTEEFPNGDLDSLYAWTRPKPRRLPISSPASCRIPRRA